METIGERLRSVRKENKATQGDFAKLAGLGSYQAISAIERGETKEPGARTLEPIARRYGLSLRWLLTGEGPKHDGAQSDSQSQDERYSKEIISDTARILIEDLSRRGELTMGLDMEHFMQLFLDVLDIRAGWTLRPTFSNYVEIGSAIEQRFVSGGGGGSERDARASDFGLSSRGSSKNQRSKTRSQTYSYKQT